MKLFLILIVAVSALFTACERPPVANNAPIDHNTMDHSKMDHSKMDSSPNAAQAPYELQFIDTMIMHHQGAVDMAQLAETRAQHEELKTLAKAIIADQQKEIAQMKKWRGEWFAGRPQAINMDFPGMRDGMKGMDTAKLDALKANDFDLEFIKQMIPHHEGAVAMAKDAVAKFPTDPAKQTPMAEAFRSFADSIVKAQETEIKQMRDWQSAWSK
ncbi:MAG: DUF305 domain-containing protein [Saprospiraceae bacterium]|nr:DUF305 domain-containing protein [Pyrinomonadaceae bacterium]